MLNTILLSIAIILLIVLIVLLIVHFKKPININNQDDLNLLNQNLKENISGVKKDLKDDISNLKQEMDTKLSNIQIGINNTVVTQLKTIRESMQDAISNMQKDNADKLDEMRRTVDEKLDKTLNDRLTQSFKLVQENLNAVSEGLGEMKNLATGVGDLKKVLSNVKTRGIWGEMQLSQILSEILTKEQYEENVVTKPKSKDPVEFAIKLPGDGTSIVRLPIDSKFPLDTYSNLLDAYDSTDKAKVDDAIKVLKERIKKCAKDISDKYLEPPFTTDFGIMFLPVEGLYAEVAKAGLIEELQNTYRIIVAGPTTMAALLNSLQVGFRTLAIQKRSSEVWKILSAVKTEFNKFSEALVAAQKKIQQADKDIELLVGTRTRVMQSKLQDVTEISFEESKELLGE